LIINKVENQIENTFSSTIGWGIIAIPARANIMKKIFDDNQDTGASKTLINKDILHVKVLQL